MQKQTNKKHVVTSGVCRGGVFGVWKTPLGTVQKMNKQIECQGEEGRNRRKSREREKRWKCEV